MNVALTVLFWSVAAFRPNDVAPDVTRTLNDIGWFLFEFQWPVFCVWFVGVAAAIFRDYNIPRILPVWVAYVNIAAALLSAPYGLMLFFKTGAFSGRGLIGFYLPTGVTFAWMLVMSVMVLRALKASGRDVEQATSLERSGLNSAGERIRERAPY